MTRSRFALLGMLVASAMASLWGAAALIDFDSRPGEHAEPPSLWPNRSSILPRAEGPQMVVFAHPLCSCTTVTLEELIDLPKVQTTILFADQESSTTPEQSKSWTLANRIAGATVRRDKGSVEAKLFHVSTSGTVLLYSAKGKLLFDGGISAARGHRGANLGLERLTKALQTGEESNAISPVFGCGLERERA